MRVFLALVLAATIVLAHDFHDDSPVMLSNKIGLVDRSLVEAHGMHRRQRSSVDEFDVESDESTEQWGAKGSQHGERYAGLAADRARGALVAKGVPEEFANKATNFAKNKASVVGGHAGERLAAAYDSSKARNGKFARLVGAAQTFRGDRGLNPKALDVGDSTTLNQIDFADLTTEDQRVSTAIESSNNALKHNFALRKANVDSQVLLERQPLACRVDDTMSATSSFNVSSIDALEWWIQRHKDLSVNAVGIIAIDCSNLSYRGADSAFPLLQLSSWYDELYHTVSSFCVVKLSMRPPTLYDPTT
ncbi:hypothetical protein AC1031_014663 [Aphanomyces cochlioides]|nr:hypothetical protein AC1031_014662 [Aphanomyces cochlioides]KAG9398323.1 hypothetical protein AC1031_014663 [Aphanomyces cochlioides]